MKKILLYIVIFLSCGFILGFLNKRHQSMKIMQLKSIIVDDTFNIDTIKGLVLKGDKEEWVELKRAYWDIRYSQELLLYSLIMANKFNLPNAYFWVYTNWTDIYKIHFPNEKMDDKTNKIVIDYLKRGVELKDNSSIGKMEDICHK